MKPIYRTVIGLGLIVSTSPRALAQDPATLQKDDVAELREQVKDLTKLVNELKRQVEEKSAADPAVIPAPGEIPRVSEPPPGSLPQADPDFSTELTPVTPRVSPSSSDPDFATDLTSEPLPPPKRTDLSVFNPEFSAAIDAVGSYSASTGNLNFTLRDVELMVQSNVDELAHAYVVLNAESALDPWTKNDTFKTATLGVEEAAIETTSLPYGLALKGGEFFADFTRLGKIHSHELPFTDRPAVLENLIGGETRSRGLELNWVPPVGHYIRLTAGAVDNIGADTATTGLLTTIAGDKADLFATRGHRSFGDFMYYTRAATIFELSNSVSLNLGVDYARGGDAGTRELASGDFKLTWIPDPTSFDRFEAGGEFLHGKTDGAFGPSALVAGGPAGGSVSASGAYLYAQYRIGKKWEPGIRYDWFRPEAWSQTDANSDGIADGISRTTSTRDAVSAYLTYNFSEFDRLRFEISHIHDSSGSLGGYDDDWLGLLQWSITLGPHKHSFQP
jgi:hypothetical protein